jgi:hypothetical protein
MVDRREKEREGKLPWKMLDQILHCGPRRIMKEAAEKEYAGSKGNE